MRLVSFGAPGDWRSGIDLGDHVAESAAVARLAGWNDGDVAAARCNRSLISRPEASLCQLGDVARQRFSDLASAGALHSTVRLRLGPPIPDPQKIICIGLNYHDHAKEVGATPPDHPIFFAKFANSLAGPADDIVPPRETEKLDYEAELAIVIGRRGRRITASDALEHVAGAMALNDVSARDLQLADQLWTGGKAVDTFAPCGPALVLKSALGDLQDLKVETRVGGRTLQSGTTASMVHKIPDVIAFLSRIMTLEPGDIIATGTPAGVAGSHRPPRFLKSGDIVEVEIVGIGTLRNRVAKPV